MVILITTKPPPCSLFEASFLSLSIDYSLSKVFHACLGSPYMLQLAPVVEQFSSHIVGGLYQSCVTFHFVCSPEYRQKKVSACLSRTGTNVPPPPHTHTRTCARTYVHTHARTLTHTRARTHARARARAHTHTHTQRARFNSPLYMVF